MEATVTITVTRDEIVPSDGRVEWLESHGVPPEQADVQVTATLADWRRIGVGIKADGTVSLYGGRVIDAFRAAAVRVACETGRTPEVLPPEIVAATIGAIERRQQVEEADERDKAESAKRGVAELMALDDLDLGRLVDEISGMICAGDHIRGVRLGDCPQLLDRTRGLRVAADTEKKKRALEAKAEAEVEKNQWIQQYGSERLREALRLGLGASIAKSYGEERLAADRPGWRYASEYQGDDVEMEIREPTLTELTALATAREVDSATILVWIVTRHDEDCPAGDDCTCDARRGRALAADYLGRRIVRDL